MKEVCVYVGGGICGGESGIEDVCEEGVCDKVYCVLKMWEGVCVCVYEVIIKNCIAYWECMRRCVYRDV